MSQNKSLRMTVTVNPELFPELFEHMDGTPSRLRSLKICELASNRLLGSESDVISSPADPRRDAEKQPSEQAPTNSLLLSGLSAAMT
jgi:hypothetical protein